MLGHQFNPLDGVLETLSRNRHLLTPEHVEFLRVFIGAPKNKLSSVVSEKSTINELLDTLTVMAGSLKQTASEAKDPEAFKSVIGSIEKVMSMVNKYTEQVSQEEKMRALQDSIMETLQEMPDGLQKTFLDKWQAKIDALAK